MRQSPSVTHQAAGWCVYLLLAALLLASLVQSHGLNFFHGVTLQELVYGEAPYPSVQRVLLPSLIRAAAMATPESVAEAIRHAVNTSPSGQALLAKINTPPELAYEALWELVLLFLSLLLYCVFLHRHALALYPSVGAWSLLAPVLGCAFLWASVPAYLYDFPTAASFAACYYYSYRGKRGLLLAWFALAMLNRETAWLLIPVYALYRWSLGERKQVIVITAALGAITLAVKLLVMVAFAGREGGYSFWRVADKIGVAVQSLTQLNVLVPLLILLWLLSWRWQEKPFFLKIALLPLLPLLAGYLIVGWPGELRVFIEVFPVFALLSLHTLLTCLPQNPLERVRHSG